MATSERPQPTPNWSTNTKLIVGLTIVAIVAATIIYFRNIIGPLLLAIILAYLLHPIASYLSRATKLNWRMSVNIVYLVVLILLAGFFTWSGYTITQQFQSLIRVVQNFIEITLPNLATQLSETTYFIGPFPIDFSQFDLQYLSEQVLNILQPILGQMATIISTFAASAAVTMGWLLFILVISYFLLAEGGQVPVELFKFEIPGYDHEIRRLAGELRNIWNAFLRGQLFIFGLAVVLNLILLSILGLRISLGIAILAGLSKFVPYLGPFIVLVIAGVVSFFQAYNVFGLQAWQFTLLVLVSWIILDQTFDNILTPRILGRTLNLHPAAILVVALIAFNLIGIVGLILAAPTLATVKLLVRYTIRKMFDLDPWHDTAEAQPPMESPWSTISKYLRNWWQSLLMWVRSLSNKKTQP
ncbi:MAG: AI-2E family transporter [Anaerolineales bacterium]|nr:AI-2E family transporter [Anaerolineales bacterium]